MRLTCCFGVETSPEAQADRASSCVEIAVAYRGWERRGNDIEVERVEACDGFQTTGRAAEEVEGARTVNLLLERFVSMRFLYISDHLGEIRYATVGGGNVA